MNWVLGDFGSTSRSAVLEKYIGIMYLIRFMAEGPQRGLIHF